MGFVGIGLRIELLDLGWGVAGGGGIVFDCSISYTPNPTIQSLLKQLPETFPAKI
jgi:hypothetical protein